MTQSLQDGGGVVGAKVDLGVLWLATRSLSGQP